MSNIKGGMGSISKMPQIHSNIHYLNNQAVNTQSSRDSDSKLLSLTITLNIKLYLRYFIEY